MDITTVQYILNVYFLQSTELRVLSSEHIEK